SLSVRPLPGAVPAPGAGRSDAGGAGDDLGRVGGRRSHPHASERSGWGLGQAWLEWLPQEAILFDGARLRRQTEVNVAPGGQFLGCEMIVFGRLARGE